MPYLPALCPNCGADLSVDVDDEKGYCTHCGSVINYKSAIQNAVFNQPIEFEGYESYSTLVKMIEDDLRNGDNQTPDFRDKLNRAIELNPDDLYLYSLMESEIWKAKIENNVFFQYDGKAQKVVVPKGIEIINTMAFGRSMNLLEVVLPQSLKMIQPNAFFYESRLTICARVGSYGAKYALASPARLKVIGKTKNDHNTVEEIESILREFDAFKKETYNNLESHFDKVYETKWFLVLLVLSPAIFGFYITLQGIIQYAGLSLLVIFYTIVTFIIIASMSGYNEIKRKVAIKRQMRLFLNKGNQVLNPLGITDFMYTRNIFDNPYDYLETELAKLKNARKRVFQLDFSEIYKKPKIYYSMFDYFRGLRPSDYDDK